MLYAHNRNANNPHWFPPNQELDFNVILFGSKVSKNILNNRKVFVSYTNSNEKLV